MVMESYFTKYAKPKGPRRKRKRANELDPNDKGKSKYQEHYGL